MSVRVRLVGAVLGMVLLLAFGVRTSSGWSPTRREQLQTHCQRDRRPDECIALGLDLAKGTSGPVDLPSGLGALESACQLESGPGCYLAGDLQTDPNSARSAFQRGCDLEYWDACVRLAHYLKKEGKADQAERLLRRSCTRGSVYGCAVLGELAFRSSSIEPSVANAAFVSACDGGYAWSCWRAAQALACGRGVTADVARALPGLQKGCDDGFYGACSSLIEFGIPDGGLADAGSAMERALFNHVLSVSGRDSSIGLRAASGLRGELGAFARAVVELRADHLEEAGRALATIDGGPADVEVTRRILESRKTGTPWPEAAWVGWGRAGRPDLRSSPWYFATESDDVFSCSPPVKGPIRSARDFVRRVATTGSRSRLDAHYDAEVVAAATRFVFEGSIGLSLIAYSVLAAAAQDGRSTELIAFEAFARASLARRGPKTVFFALLGLPSVLEKRAATPDEIEVLEGLDELANELPSRDVFSEFARVTHNRESAFQLTVGVVWEFQAPKDISAWLERGGFPASRRAGALRALGRALVNRPWLVYHFTGVSMLKASLEIEEDGPTRELQTATSTELDLLYGGATGLRAFGALPFLTLDIDKDLDAEMDELRRLHTLASEPP